jgi:hypothetical protein
MSCEKPGILVGLSNIVTAARGRVPRGPDPASDPGLRDRLRTHARRALEGREAYIHDAVLFGRRLRLFTNSFHLADFWKENFHSEAEWRARVGPPPERGRTDLAVHAMIDIPEEPEGSYVSPSLGEVYLFNTSWYGDLRASALEALDAKLAPGARIFHGAAAIRGGRAAAFLYPREVIHPTPVWSLLEEYPDARLLAEGWFAVDDRGWIHPIEKGLYLRTTLLEHFPRYAGRVLSARFENVPDPDPEAAQAARAKAQAVQDAALAAEPHGPLRGFPVERAREILLRLLASSDARMMVAAEAFVGKARLARDPVAPAAVFLLEAGAGDPFRPARQEPFGAPTFAVRVGALPADPRAAARRIAEQVWK